MNLYLQGMNVHPARLHQSVQNGARKKSSPIGDRRAYIYTPLSLASTPLVGVLRGPDVPKHLLDETHWG